MNNEYFLSLGQVNRYVTVSFDGVMKAPAKKAFLNDFFDKCKSAQFASRVTNGTRADLSEWAAERLNEIYELRTYQRTKPEIGTTFLPVVDRKSGTGIVLRLKIREQVADEQRFLGVAGSYESTFNKIKQIVLGLIGNGPGKELYVNSEYFKNLHFEIQTPFGNMLNEHIIEGASLELPLALSLVSWLINVPFPNDILSSGTVGEDGTLSLVDGIREKISSSIEYEEIKRILVPSGTVCECEPIIQFEYAENLLSAIEACFPNYNKARSELQRNGFVTYDYFTATINGSTLPAAELKFRVNEKERITPSIIRTFKQMQVGRPEVSVLIISNAIANYFTSYVTAYFANRIPVIAVYDPKLAENPGSNIAVIVRSEKPEFTVGGTINYTVQK